MSFRALGALLCGALLMLAGAASAIEGNPIGGVGVGVETSPSGIIIAATQTNGTGDYVFNNIPDGNYVVKVTTGRDKGKILKTITLTKRGSIGGKLPKPSTGGGSR